jgi:WD40-like Beta Propeller Repeat
VIDADGSNRRFIYGEPAINGLGWSPDGVKLVAGFGFCSAGCDERLFTINSSDGSNYAELQTRTDGRDYLRPDWSPDGARIAYALGPPGGFDLYTVMPDGTNPTLVAADVRNPSWSPNGQKIAFDRASDIWTMNADGTGQTQITTDPGLDIEPTWSPDGAKIAFASARNDHSGGCHNEFDCNFDIFVMSASGAGQTHITNTTDFERDPSWQPIPQTYARPKGATPFKTYLVPAYKPCTAPNRTHGSPLAFPSCAPPQQASDFLTIGTADSNGKPTTSVDSVRYDVIPGNPATPADEADVALQIAMRDIRNKSDLSDYTGEVQVTSNLRITDKDNTPNPGGPGPGTTEDAPLSATVQCASTTDTTTGSDCNLTTSVDALYPGAVKEGRRAVWQLGQVQVSDGGSDGLASTVGNTLFMDEGVFVP